MITARTEAATGFGTIVEAATAIPRDVTDHAAAAIPLRSKKRR